jgi:hypothetical protein
MVAERELPRREKYMEIKDLQRLTLPKLRDLAKQETDLKGVGGMEN